MRRNLIETGMGMVVLVVAGVFLVLAYNATNFNKDTGYLISAEFNRIGSIKVGSDVRVSGVPVGRVVKLFLDPKSFMAQITIDIDAKYSFPLDTVAVIESEGLLGGNFVALIPGGDEEGLVSGDVLEFTQDAVDISQMLGKFMFSSGADKHNDTKNQ
jgi:phospholipid/cholesterol/gamma-HCH transport system substrate-binding protein